MKINLVQYLQLLFILLLLSSCQKWDSLSIHLKDCNIEFVFYHQWTHPTLNESNRKIEIADYTVYLPINTGGNNLINIYTDTSSSLKMLILQDRHTLTIIDLINKKSVYEHSMYDFSKRRNIAKYQGCIELDNSRGLIFISPLERDERQLNGIILKFM